MSEENNAKPRVGAQLYTIRASTKTLPDIEKSLRRIRDIGYQAIQISGFGPADPRDVAKVVEDCELTVAATHMGWDSFLNDIDTVIETHHTWGCRHAAIGGLPEEYRSIEGIARFAGELQPVAEKLRAAGLDFSYHNHSHELVKYNGRTWLERLYEAAGPEDLKAEIDVYWITAGGGDPADWVRRLGNRQPLVHLKDMSVLPDRTQRFAEVGEGNMNWPAILEACREAEVEWYLVEQDDCYDADPFDALATSYRNLVEMGLQ
jgi:sugar phosphate isomerase/epimerase